MNAPGSGDRGLRLAPAVRGPRLLRGSFITHGRPTWRRWRQERASAPRIRFRHCRARLTPREAGESQTRKDERQRRHGAEKVGEVHRLPSSRRSQRACAIATSSGRRKAVRELGTPMTAEARRSSSNVIDHRRVPTRTRRSIAEIEGREVQIGGEDRRGPVPGRGRGAGRHRDGRAHHASVRLPLAARTVSVLLLLMAGMLGGLYVESLESARAPDRARHRSAPLCLLLAGIALPDPPLLLGSGSWS